MSYQDNTQQNNPIAHSFLARRTNLVHNFFNMFIALLHIFRATMCPSSYLCDNWYLSLSMDDCLVCREDFALHASHPYTVTNTSCRIGTVFSPDDWHIVARKMWRREINILRKIVHQVGSFYKKTVCNMVVLLRTILI
jgi:hypothetical protein